MIRSQDMTVQVDSGCRVENVRKCPGLTVIGLGGMLFFTAACTPVDRHRLDVIPAPSWLDKQRRLIDWRTWSLRGRVSVTTEKTTVQSNLFWHRDGPDHRVRLSGPWGVGVTELVITPATMVLTTSQGRRHHGPDVHDMVREHFGWDTMPDGLPHWLVGVPAPFPKPEQLVFDGRGEMSLLIQDGWRVRYLDYVPVADWGAGWRLPRRLQLVRPPVRVMVYVEEWR